MHRLSYKDFFFFRPDMNLSLMRTFKENWEKIERKMKIVVGVREIPTPGKQKSGGDDSHILIFLNFLSIFSQFSLNFLISEKTQFSVVSIFYFFVFLFTGTKSALKTFLLSNHFFHTFFLFCFTFSRTEWKKNLIFIYIFLNKLTHFSKWNNECSYNMLHMHGKKNYTTTNYQNESC